MRFYTRPRRKPTIIIVTMIDVFSVLLIFFIVATTFKRTPNAIKIVLPKATEGAPITQNEPILLTITPDEKIFVNSKEIPVSQLDETFQQLGKQNPQPAIAMQADKKAPFGLIIRVMDSAKAAGFTQLPAFIDKPAAEK